MTLPLQRIPKLGLALACALAASTALAQPVMEKPRYAIGDRWEFRGQVLPDGTPNNSIRTLIDFANSNLLKVRQEDGRVADYDGAMNFMPGGSNARILTRYPMKVGDEWDISRRIEGTGMVETGKVRVAAYEPIRVPAGTFQCFRVEAVTNLTQGAHKEDRIWKRWYCPDVKYFARESIDTTIVNPSNPASGGRKTLTSELVSFTPGK